MPTADQAHTYMRTVRRHCNLSVGEDVAGTSRAALTGRVLLRSSKQRSIRNLQDVLRVLRRHLRNVTVMRIDDLSFCTQVRWLDANVVLSVHGSHLVNQAFMRAGTHLIEILPWLYEQDCNFAGCGAHHRHVLVGEPTQKENASAPRIARLASASISGRRRARTAQIQVPTTELDRLVSRIVTSQTARGRFVCQPSRCAYV